MKISFVTQNFHQGHIVACYSPEGSRRSVVTDTDAFGFEGFSINRDEFQWFTWVSHHFRWINYSAESGKDAL
ncbi:hypothetical protein AYI70_g8039 [Smittium culicis]|uniref:Uncharacterized protein n=1 Tax=Smittium culicis TaxID=133412 RepID=A0A1R1XHT9_9FUNG|nr:hypothetical protein AYI70_g8039 [Smittium culicis]